MTYYDDISAGYDVLHEEEQMRKIEIMKRHLIVQESDILLDVGCGSGISTRIWPCKRTGIDPSEKLIAIAKEKDPEGTYLVGKAEQLPFPDRLFDAVISVTAIHNFTDYKRGLSEMKRVGKDCFAFSVLNSAKDFRDIMHAILMNFHPQRIIKEEKDVIFITNFIKEETKEG